MGQREGDSSMSPPEGRSPSGLSLPNHLEIDVHLRHEQIVFLRWIGCDGNITGVSAGAEIVVIPPSVGVTQLEVHSGGKVVSQLSHDAVNILLGIENIVVDQVRIERELFGVLIPKVDLPIVFLLQLADTESSLIRVALAALARLTSGVGATATLKIRSEVGEYPHGYSPRFPAEFRWHIEHQQAVDPGLILRQRRCIRYVGRTALIVNVKCVAVACVIVECRRKLEVKVVREIKPCPYLPREQERVGVRD